MIVKKEWGSELCLVNTEFYCTKMLYLRPGMKCSLHYHPIKDETFHVMDSGSHNSVPALCLEVGDEKKFLHTGDVVRIPPGTKHRFSNHGERTIVMVESSTHHSDDDVVRIEPSGQI